MKLSYRNQRNANIIADYYSKPLNKPDWYSINAMDDDQAELFIYDYIGWPYNDAGELTRQMASMRDTHLIARINSPGGDVWDGMAILNAFVNHPGGVTTRIESLAASIASVLAMGGKTVEAYSNTMMMIHNSWVFMAGNRQELLDTADLLGQIDENIVGSYTAKTKLGKKEVREMMAADTWMNAKKMKEKGFIDTIIQSGKPAKAQFDLSMFANAPESIELNDGNNEEPTIRDIEKALRDVGCSQKKAKALIAGSNQAESYIEEIDNLRAAVSNLEMKAALQSTIAVMRR